MALESMFARSPTLMALCVSAGASASLLAGAHIFEAIGFPPCALCLDQREAHWAGLGVAAAGIAAALLFRAKAAAAATVGALALVYTLSAGLSFYHTGVEFGFWPGPATCSTLGATVLDVSDLTKALTEAPSGPACNEAAWRLFGISMAGYNMLASAGLSALTLVAAFASFRGMKASGLTEIAS